MERKNHLLLQLVAEGEDHLLLQLAEGHLLVQLVKWESHPLVQLVVVAGGSADQF